jgi:hypothetical protein
MERQQGHINTPGQAGRSRSWPNLGVGKIGISECEPKAGFLWPDQEEVDTRGRTESLLYEGERLFETKLPRKEDFSVIDGN